MALALYRKYRPRTFAEIIGQDHVTEPLSQALRSGRLHHAYLFSGPRGCGKTSSARILARSLNCEQGPTPEPCGHCLSCRSLANDGTGSIDVIEIDAASHGGVDDARELREKAFFAPANSRFKIYVIDEAHMVSSAGFNALLKLVEEPPEYVKFIFATTEPEKVLGTIRSRTHHYPFRLIPPAILRPYLAQLCDAEGVHVDPAVFPLVVRAGGGSARDSLSVLDQLIAGAGADGVGYARAVALLGVTDVALIDEMCDALAAGDGAAAYATIDRVAQAGHDPRRFASDLLERLRDLIILQQVPDAVTKGLIDGPADEMERMTAQAARLGPATLSRCADIVHTGLVEMRGTTAPRLLLELVTARMLLPGAEDSTGALLQRLERMERRVTLGAGAAGSVPGDDPQVRATPAPAAPTSVAPPPSSAGVSSSSGAGGPAGGSAAPAAVAGHDTPTGVPDPAAVMPDPPVEPGVEPGAAVAVGELSAAAVREAWPEIVTMVGRRSKKVAALASGAVVRDLDGRTVVLTFRFPAHARMVAAQPELLSDALYETLGDRWQIRCEVSGEAGGSPGSAPAASPRGGTTAAASPTAPSPTAPSPVTPPPAPSPVTPPTASSPVTPPPAVRPDGPPGPPRSNDTVAQGGPAPGRAPGTRHGTGAGAGAGPDAGPPRPTGAGPGHPTAGLAVVARDVEDWPEPARPGGLAPVGDGAGVAGTAVPEAAASVTVGSAAVGGGRTAAPVVSGGLAAARAAAAGAGAARTPTSSGPTSPGSASPGSAAWSDGSPAEEPPYDPDYDGPVRPATAAYEGFDPGDEPLDDVIDEKTARQSSEQQAMQLLRDAFGAEKIGEA